MNDWPISLLVTCSNDIDWSNCIISGILYWSSCISKFLLIKLINCDVENSDTKFVKIWKIFERLAVSLISWTSVMSSPIKFGQISGHWLNAILEMIISNCLDKSSGITFLKNNSKIWLRKAIISCWSMLGQDVSKNL